MHGLALQQPGDGGQSGVGVGANLERMGIVEIGGKDQVDEAPWANGSSSLGGEHPADGHAANRGRTALTDVDVSEGALVDRGVGGLYRSAQWPSPDRGAELLLLTLVVGVFTGRMIGDVDDLGQGGYGLEQDPLDALLQGDLRKTATLTPSEQAEIGDRPVD